MSKPKDLILEVKIPANKLRSLVTKICVARKRESTDEERLLTYMIEHRDKDNYFHVYYKARKDCCDRLEMSVLSFNYCKDLLIKNKHIEKTLDGKHYKIDTSFITALGKHDKIKTKYKYKEAKVEAMYSCICKEYEPAHTCPLKSELYGDDTLCTCCKICTNDCSMSL